MKYKEERPLANLDAAVKKLLEIANGFEPDHAGRIHVGAINAQFMSAGGDAFDLWWAWAKKPLHSPLTIDAAIHEAVMSLPPNERHDRAKVNEAVRRERGG
jgi:hypothetical protein